MIGKSNKSSVEVAQSVQSPPSNPLARVIFPLALEILVSILGLGGYPLYIFCPVLPLAVALTLC